MWSHAELANVFEKIDGLRQEMVKAQIKLTAIPAVGPKNGGEGEAKKAEAVKELLRDAGFEDVREFRAPDKTVPSGYRPNLWATVKGKKPNNRLVVMTHTDIVPPGAKDAWLTDPYVVAEKQGKLYGRGVEDNQQDLVASIFAIKALKLAGVKPEHDVAMLFAADEETSSEFGLAYLLKKEKNLFRKDDISLVPDGGSADGLDIEIAEKSIIWMKIITKGKMCHASMPANGVNAARASAHLISRLDVLLPKIFSPATSTFEPTKREANVDCVNQLPGEDVSYLDCRVLPDYKVDDVVRFVQGEIKKVEKQFKVKITLDFAQKEQAAPATSENAPVVKMLKDAIVYVSAHAGGCACKECVGPKRKLAKPVKPKVIGIGGGTCAALLRRIGIPSVVWAKLPSTCHTPNEWCNIDDMLFDAKVFAYMMGRE
jgi:succinyl-diaminopimelate desuccinylase